jgi:two-component system sporulation sensor kinase A
MGKGKQILLNKKVQRENLEENMVKYWFAQSTDGLMIYNKERAFLEVNEKGAEMFGLSPSEMIGKTLKELLGDHAARFDVYVEEALIKKREVSVVHDVVSSGEIKFYDCIYTPILNPNGDAIGVGVISKNVTRREYERSSLNDVLSDEYLKCVKHLQNLVFKIKKRKTGEIVFLFSEGIIAHVLRITTDRVFGKTAKEVFQPDVAELVEEHFQKSFTGKVVYFELTLYGLIFNTTLSPIIKDGKVVEVLGFITDITKRKNIEKKLRETEEKYQLLVKLSPEPIMVQREGKILYINPAGVKMLGVQDKNELIGTSIFKFVHPDFHERLKVRQKQLEDKGDPDVLEAKVIRPDGQLVDVEVTSSPITYMDKPAILSIIRDITVRKRAEEALQKSEAKYRLIADNMSDLIGVLDVNGVVQYASPSHKTILGFPPETYEGYSAFDWVHPEDIPYIKEKFAEMVIHKNPTRVEFRNKHVNGGWITVEVIGTPVVNEQGEVEQVLVVGRDVTEQRKTEELLRKSEKLAVVGELAAGVAHEIRNPLTSIKGFLQFLKPHTDDKKYFDLMLSEIDRIESIINEFLLLAKPHTVKFTENDLSVLLTDIMTLMEPQMSLRNIQIELDIEPELPSIYCERNQLKQVFINIIKNAMEAMPEGGHIRIQCRRYGNEKIMLRFIDEGCGIPKERLSKLGEPFYTMKEKGTGLGLMVCYKIIENHKGKIEIESEEGKGTTVNILLPIQRS